jgi:hypothetical protein
MINGREGYDATFDVEIMIVMKIREVAFPIEDRYYVITCTAPAEVYKDYADAFETAINSFVIEYTTPVTPPPAAEAPEKGIPGFEAVFAIAGLLTITYHLLR